jgi:hypothetical protein
MSFANRFNVSAPPTTRQTWSAVSKALVHATSSHEMRTGDERSPPAIGGVAVRATAEDFEKLGVIVDTGTVTDITPTSSVVEINETNDITPTSSVVGINETNDITYTATVADSEGLSYVAYVRMAAGLHTATATGHAAPAPIALHALQLLSNVSPAFDRDVKGVHTILQKAFGTTVVCTDTAATETLDHTVGTGTPCGTRVFPTDTERHSPSLLSTKSSTTVVFDANNAAQYDVTTHTMHQQKTNQNDPGYIAAQSVTIEEICGAYTATVLLACSPPILGGGDVSVFKTAALLPYHDDCGVTPRQSTVHVLTAGRHFATNVTHTHDAYAARTLHVPVYAALHALAQTHLCLAEGIKEAMKEGSVETLHADTPVPMVVMRGSRTPVVAMFVPNLSAVHNETLDHLGCAYECGAVLGIGAHCENSEMCSEYDSDGSRGGHSQEVSECDSEEHPTNRSRCCTGGVVYDDTEYGPGGDRSDTEMSPPHSPIDVYTGGWRVQDTEGAYTDPNILPTTHLGSIYEEHNMYPDAVRVALMRHWNH